MTNIPAGSGTTARLAGVLTWVVRLAGLNLLWVLGLLAGGVIVGFAPATVALAGVLRALLQGQEVRLWKDFWQHWRSSLLPAQLSVGFPLATVVVLAFYVVAAGGSESPLLRGSAVGLSVLLLLYIATVLHLPFLFATFDCTATELWRLALVVAWRSPWHTLGTLVGSVAAVVAMAVAYPAALLLYAVSGPVFLAAVLGERAVRRAQAQARRAQGR